MHEGHGQGLAGGAIGDHLKPLPRCHVQELGASVAGIRDTQVSGGSFVLWPDFDIGWKQNLPEPAALCCELCVRSVEREAPYRVLDVVAGIHVAFTVDGDAGWTFEDAHSGAGDGPTRAASRKRGVHADDGSEAGRRRCAASFGDPENVVLVPSASERRRDRAREGVDRADVLAEVRLGLGAHAGGCRRTQSDEEERCHWWQSTNAGPGNRISEHPPRDFVHR